MRPFVATADMESVVTTVTIFAIIIIMREYTEKEGRRIFNILLDIGYISLYFNKDNSYCPKKRNLDTSVSSCSSIKAKHTVKETKNMAKLKISEYCEMRKNKNRDVKSSLTESSLAHHPADSQEQHHTPNVEETSHLRKIYHLGQWSENSG